MYRRRTKHSQEMHSCGGGGGGKPIDIRSLNGSCMKLLPHGTACAEKTGAVGMQSQMSDMALLGTDRMPNCLAPARLKVRRVTAQRLIRGRQSDTCTELLERLGFSPDTLAVIAAPSSSASEETLPLGRTVAHTQWQGSGTPSISSHRTDDIWRSFIPCVLVLLGALCVTIELRGCMPNKGVTSLRKCSKEWITGSLD